MRLPLLAASALSGLVAPAARADCASDYALFCAGTTPNASTGTRYVCQDARLGPVQLPSRLPLDSFVAAYDRFGGLCPGQFLATFYDAAAGEWLYPDDDGFQLDTAGAPILANMTLAVGMLVDRFGGPTGSYMSPAYAPYIQRSIPPSNLDGDARFPYDYHVYRVVRSFEVQAGPIAPWFGQPGQGIQYKLSQSVLTYVDSGHLQPINLTTLE